MRLWRCYRCDRGFIHARYLVAHLIDLHGEQPGGHIPGLNGEGN